VHKIASFASPVEARPDVEFEADRPDTDPAADYLGKENA